MPEINDPKYLLEEQYRNASNLNARQALHARFGLRHDWFAWILDHFQLGPGARILELGCGPGDLWQSNLQRLPQDWDITLSDFSPGMLAQAQANLASSGRVFHFRQMDAQEIPEPAASFDLVVANHMLYHVPDLSRALSGIRRVLRPAGRLLAATNGQGHMRELSELVEGFDPTMEARRMRMTYPFSLENGAPLLSAHFETVRLHAYPDELQVTEVEPLVEYVFSATTLGVAAEYKERFRAYVAAQLEQAHGVLVIHKEVGLFEAS